MNETYQTAREGAINLLCEQLAYLEQEMAAARMSEDTKAFASLMRVFLPAQKEYLRLCRENEYSAQVDELLAFTGGADACP